MGNPRPSTSTSATHEEVARLQSALESTADGILVVDPDGVITWYNQRFRDLWSLPDEPLLGRRERELRPRLASLLEDPDGFLASLRAMDEEPTAACSHVLILRDGRVYERACCPQRVDGDVIGRVWTCHDVTVARRAEAARLESEEKYRSLYNRTPVMLHSIDAVGRLVAVSDYWLARMGYSRAEVLGRRSVEFLTPESQRRAVEEVLPAFTRTGACKDVPYQFVTRTGEVLDVLLSATSERDAEGQVVRSLAVLLDVTERVRAERELAGYRARLEDLVAERTLELGEAYRELELFSASVSHDLRAPVRAIEAFSRLLLDEHGASLDPAARGYLERIRAATTRQSRLIEDLLRLSHVGRAEMHLAPVDVTRLAREVAAERAGAEPSRRVEVEVEEGLTASADEALLRIALENLFDNAWKFTAGRDVAHVRLTSSTVDGVRAFHVSDDGVGFEMAEVGRLFQPFSRLHGKGFSGTGIGLATVARIVKRHGGRAWADAKVGEGTTISFTLAPPAEVGQR